MDLMHLIEAAMTSPAIYPVLLLLAVLDAVLPVVPSETVVIAAAVFAASGVPNLPLIMLVAAVGAFAGDHLGYALGRLLRRRRSTGRLARAVDRVTPHLHRRGGSLIVAARFVPGGRTAVVTASGATGYPLARFTGYAAVAAVLWAGYSGLIGFVGGAAFEANPMLGLALGLGLAVAITALGELVRLWRSRRRAADGAGLAGPPVDAPPSTDAGARQSW